jgi:hypothetical protein
MARYLATLSACVSGQLSVVGCPSHPGFQRVRRIRSGLRCHDTESGRGLPHSKTLARLVYAINEFYALYEIYEFYAINAFYEFNEIYAITINEIYAIYAVRICPEMLEVV